MLNDIHEQITFPKILNVGTKAAWTTLNKKANTLLGYACEGAANYSNPIIDIDGKHWFIVNPEVSELVDLTKCVEYSEIVLPQPKLN
jgi:hypothetical protein